jgi:hypothetical protein
MEYYCATAGAGRLGTAEAIDASAIKKAAKEFSIADLKRLIALRPR